MTPRTSRPRSETVSLLIESRAVAVIRTAAWEQVLPACRALSRGGVDVVEITLTTPNALECIRQARIELGHRVVVGAGSVLNLLQAREALDAGADFLVTPITRTSLVAAAHDRDCPVMIGALTPTEAQQAHEAGADFVKLFPADQLGPAYVKALRAPLPHLRLVPTGGVTLENARQFLEAGAALLGLGSSLIPEAIWETRDWDDLTRRAELLMSRLRTTA